MKALNYTIIKTQKQYSEYCDILEKLILQDEKALSDEIELLILLVEKWDTEHNTFNDLDPAELIKAF